MGRSRRRLIQLVDLDSTLDGYTADVSEQRSKNSKGRKQTLYRAYLYVGASLVYTDATGWCKSQESAISLILERARVLKSSMSAAPPLSRRLLVIQACIQCPHSEGTSHCWNRDTQGRALMGRAVDSHERGSRPLPDVPGYQWPEHAPPPEWCPLPKAT